MNRYEHPMHITFEEIPREMRWQACLEALKTEYTLSTKDICRMLKCSRSWMTRYIKPHVHYIFISNLFSSKDLIDFWGKAYRQGYMDRSDKSNAWYSKNELMALLKSSVKSCTRQTICLPMEELIDPSCIDGYKRERKTLIEKYLDYDISRQEMDEILINHYGSERGRFLWKTRPRRDKRTECPRVDVCDEFQDAFFEELATISSLKNYGDSDEEMYRDLFLSGATRIELAIPDKDGCFSEKVYYYRPEIDPYSESFVTVRYDHYRNG